MMKVGRVSPEKPVSVAQVVRAFAVVGATLTPARDRMEATVASCSARLSKGGTRGEILDGVELPASRDHGDAYGINLVVEKVLAMPVGAHPGVVDDDA